MKSVILIVALSASVSGKYIWGGDCPKFETIDNFELDKYGGLWYEIQHDKDIPFEIGTKCTRNGMSTLQIESM